MNVLWIVTTQWRAQATSYAGDLNVKTPFLDALAARSQNFTQAVSPHPFGPFARAALLTGVESPANGVTNYFDPLPLSTATVAHRFRERGFLTAFFGKWHLAPKDPTAALVGETHARTLVPPEYRGGFDFWEGFEGGFLLENPLLHGTRLPEPARFQGYQSDVLCERAADWLETQKGKPWFAMVSLEPPHPPYHVALLQPRSHEAPVLLRPNVPQDVEVSQRAARELFGYYQQIESTDRAIGRLLQRIRSSDTVVVFTSVHGDMHGSHGLFRKGWPYEESVRIPLLIALPDVEGKRRTETVSLTQLLALSVGAAEGQGIPQLGQRHAHISMPSVVDLTDQCDRTWKGIRNAEGKLILNEDGSPWLFFDLLNDPMELRNLANEPSTSAELESWRSRIH